jgi:beta-galactosidase
MPRTIKPSGTRMTRRDLLTHAACGALLSSAAPFLSRAESVFPSSDPLPRIRDSFDFDWKFYQGDVPAAQVPDFDARAWQDLHLPHDWSIEGAYDENAPSSGAGGYLPTGVGWYRKQFRLPESYRDRLVTLEFDGVYQNSEVWINGRSLGVRPCGFVPFAYELTPHLNLSGENVVAVRVDNSRQTNCRWYSGSGIYRHTWLHATNEVHIKHGEMFVTYPRVSKGAATVEIKTKVANVLTGDAQCTLLVSFLDAQGGMVKSTETTGTIPARGDYEFVQQIVIDHPTLWSPSNPYLYRVRCAVTQSGRTIDTYEALAGIRPVIFDADHGFLLNGEYVRLNGVCLHHEAGSVGAAVPERVWVRRLEILREMGCNAIRTSHNPFAAEFLDLCDRMGFLVMVEAFDEWKIPKPQIQNGYHLYFDEWYDRDLQSLIRRDRNHPSVVLWSAGNEIGDQADPDGATTSSKLLSVFHSEDPSRLVTAACDRIAAEPASTAARPEFLALLDVVGYNYVDRWREHADKYYSIDRETFPKRRFIGTESIGMGSIRGDYLGLIPGDVPADSPRMRFGGGRQIDTEDLWKFVRTHDYVAGDFMWTGIDYLGEASWPIKGTATGVIDTCGFKKDGYYFYQSQWTEKPMVHLTPHWNWNGKEGAIIPVTCYTNCDTVELFLNGKSFGVKGYEFPRLGMEETYGSYSPRARAIRTTGDLHLSWDVPYVQGTLKAIAVKDDSVAAVTEVSTTGAPTAVSLSADRENLIADHRDESHIVIEVRDGQERFVPVANNTISIAVEGEGRLIGVDNGDPFSHESYKANHRNAFNGLCLAIVQTTSRSGRIVITASSPGLRSDRLILETFPL